MESSHAIFFPRTRLPFPPVQISIPFRGADAAFSFAPPRSIQDLSACFPRIEEFGEIQLGARLDRVEKLIPWDILFFRKE